MPGFFADPDLFKAIRAEVAPRLRTYPTARVWVPVCGFGEDAISLAITLREERVTRVMVYATDGDSAVLERARSGTVRRESLSQERYAASGGRASLAEYFADDGQLVTVRPLILACILFAEHTLGTDGSINEFQFVLGGSGLESLSGEEKRTALDVVDQSLCPLGMLGLHDPSLALLLPSGSYDRMGETRLIRRGR